MIKLKYTSKVTIIGTILSTIITLFLSSIKYGDYLLFVITFIPSKITPDFGSHFISNYSLIVFFLLILIQNIIVFGLIGLIIDLIITNKEKIKKIIFTQSKNKK